MTALYWLPEDFCCLLLRILLFTRLASSYLGAMFLPVQNFRGDYNNLLRVAVFHLHVRPDELKNMSVVRRAPKTMQGFFFFFCEILMHRSSEWVILMLLVLVSMEVSYFG